MHPALEAVVAFVFLGPCGVGDTASIEFWLDKFVNRGGPLFPHMQACGPMLNFINQKAL